MLASCNPQKQCNAQHATSNHLPRKLKPTDDQRRAPRAFTIHNHMPAVRGMPFPQASEQVFPFTAGFHRRRLLLADPIRVCVLQEKAPVSAVSMKQQQLKR